MMRMHHTGMKIEKHASFHIVILALFIYRNAFELAVRVRVCTI